MLVEDAQKIPCLFNSDESIPQIDTTVHQFVYKASVHLYIKMFMFSCGWKVTLLNRNGLVEVEVDVET